jgi:hypothetical protein
MLYTEIKIINDKEFVYTYSDKFMIRKIGTEEIYSEAYDLIEFKDERKYEETDIELPKEDEEENVNEDDIKE